MKKYILELAVFVCWAVVMIFELVWSRILAPYLWTSIYVWTSIIGVILGSLSLWYLLWWIISDIKANNKIFSTILLISSISLLICILIKNSVLSYIVSLPFRIEIVAILSSLILFTLTSILLWMISPYAVKIKLSDLDKWASTVGSMYAISTIWSIFGTFLAWFVLIPFLPVTWILLSLSFILIIISVLTFFTEYK